MRRPIGLPLAAFFATLLPGFAFAAPPQPGAGSAAAPARPAAVYAYTEAHAHVGQRASVRGPLVAVHKSAHGTVFLDFCANYRACPFSGVIFADDAKKFGDLSRYAGKTVTLTGVIASHRGRPEIILSDPGQFAAGN